MVIETSKKENKKYSKYLDLGEVKPWSEKKRSEMTERDWRIFREDNDIIIKGGRVPIPMRAWEDVQLDPFIIDTIRRIDFKKPTSIQMQAIPIGLERRDLIGVAPTGSGKTIAFLVPLLTYLNFLPPITDKNLEDGPYALILTPTRELALQINSDFEKFAAGSRLRSTVVVGGRSAEEQAFQLRKGCELLIGTPGRIKDALESRYTSLNQCSYVIIDEADRMVELGFDEDVNIILDAIPTTNMKSEDESIAEMQEKISKKGEKLFRTTHMFSATMPSAVERIARK